MKQHNLVSQICIEDGKNLTNFDQIKDAATHHFRQIFSETNEEEEESTKELFEHIPCIITPQDNTNMIKEVTDDEIM
jgi:hypothetical protein